MYLTNRGGGAAAGGKGTADSSTTTVHHHHSHSTTPLIPPSYDFAAFFLFGLSLLCLGLLFFPFKNIDELNDLKDPNVDIDHQSMSVMSTPYRPSQSQLLLQQQQQQEQQQFDSSHHHLLLNDSYGSLNLSPIANNSSSPSHYDDENQNHLPPTTSNSTTIANNMEGGGNINEKTSLLVKTTQNTNNNYYQTNYSTPMRTPRNEDNFDPLSSSSHHHHHNHNHPNHHVNRPIDSTLFYLMLFLNFTSRGCISIYETQIAKVLITYYSLTSSDIGYYVSISGALGTIQLIFYNQLYLSFFSYDQLMIYGMGLMAVVQIGTLFLSFFTNIFQSALESINPPHITTTTTTTAADSSSSSSTTIAHENHHQAISLNILLMSLFLVYACAFPIANTALLGYYSNLKRYGEQGSFQSKFALSGLLSKFLVPIISAYLVEYHPSSDKAAFAFVLFLAAISVALLLFYRPLIMKRGYKIPDHDENNKWSFFLPHLPFIDNIHFLIALFMIILAVAFMFFV